jgi:hypothetical protein
MSESSSPRVPPFTRCQGKRPAPWPAAVIRVGPSCRRLGGVALQAGGLTQKRWADRRGVEQPGQASLSGICRVAAAVLRLSRISLPTLPSPAGGSPAASKRLQPYSTPTIPRSPQREAGAAACKCKAHPLPPRPTSQPPTPSSSNAIPDPAPPIPPPSFSPPLHTHIWKCIRMQELRTLD